MPTLSVVVPATDQPPTLDRCLAAVSGATEPPEEVVVIDRPADLSASAARNLGARRATGDVLVFVDADVVVHPDTFGRLRAVFATPDAPTAVFGSYDAAPDHPGVVSRFRNLLHHYVHQHGSGPAETFWTGLGAVRRDAFLAVGGFDEARYPTPSIEDIDFGARLVARGERVMLDPAIQGTHLKQWTLRSMVFTDFARRGAPWVALQIRNRRVARSLNCGLRHRASALCAVLAVAAAALADAVLLGVAGGAFVALNRGFYALVVRKIGPRHGLTGILLHGLHHLVAVASVPAGVALAAYLALSAPGREADAAAATRVVTE